MNSAVPTILLIEDEPLVRGAVVDVLEDLGFRVVTAASAREAAGLLQGSVPIYRAVIVDLGLPDRSGEDLAKDILAQLVDVPVIIASGSDPDALDDVLTGDVRVGFLSKPYGTRGITEALAGFGIAVERPYSS